MVCSFLKVFLTVFAYAWPKSLGFCLAWLGSRLRVWLSAISWPDFVLFDCLWIKLFAGLSIHTWHHHHSCPHGPFFLRFFLTCQPIQLGLFVALSGTNRCGGLTYPPFQYQLCWLFGFQWATTSIHFLRWAIRVAPSPWQPQPSKQFEMKSYPPYKHMYRWEKKTQDDMCHHPSSVRRQ